MKKLLLILKIIWTIFAVCLIANSTIDLIKYCEGIDVYIISFHLYILIKIWFNRMNIEDAIIITLLESTLIIRYLIDYAYYDLIDLVVIIVAGLPILLSWLCLTRKKEVEIVKLMLEAEEE